MRDIARTYRLLAVLIFAAMTWSVILPVVHVVCAMGPLMTVSMCEHETNREDPVPAATDGVHAGHGSEAIGHDPASEAMPAFPGRDLACCVTESTVLDRPATPAKLTDRQADDVLNGPRALSPGVPPVPPVFVHQPLERVVSPPLPPLSSADLSVFLI